MSIAMRPSAARPRVLQLLLSAALWAGIPSPVLAAEPGETRCGADGTVEKYQCLGSRCEWRTNYQRCANTNRAQECNIGDTKCGSDGKVLNCQMFGVEVRWVPSTQACSVIRDPADNAPDGYGLQRPYYNSYSGGTTGDSTGGGNPTKPACTLGERERGNDGNIRTCVMQDGKASWQNVNDGMRH